MWKLFSWPPRSKYKQPNKKERKPETQPDDHIDALLESPADSMGEEKDLSGFKKRVVKAFRHLSRDVRGVRADMTGSFKGLTNSLLSQHEQQKLSIQGTHRTAVEQFNIATQAIGELNGQVAALREYTAEQQEQLRRYQEGYHWTITKDFCQRIIRCVDDIEKHLKDETIEGAHRENLIMVSQQLVYALDGSGVEQVEPKVGSDFKEIRDKAQIVGKDPASSPEQNGQVSSVLAPGYSLYVTDTEIRPIRPAKVRVFSTQTGGQTHE